ncbi:hypothetical protein PIROE2DRAFT_17616 [Piromyces sp. E2]|nr:hypothetical protein PIROE2DRAFT_17616 [Piromyces sp. E2]|eukprot:OUM57411.1 hypothetical protein PIROE2DRAFT_17616 [Piromyces sp. E2]
MKCEWLFLTVILYCYIDLTTAKGKGDKVIEFLTDVFKEVGHKIAEFDEDFYTVCPKSTSYITIVDDDRCDPSKAYVCKVADQQNGAGLVFMSGEVPGQNVRYLKSCVNKNGRTQDKIFRFKLSNNQEDNFTDPFENCKLGTYYFTNGACYTMPDARRGTYLSNIKGNYKMLKDSWANGYVLTDDGWCKEYDAVQTELGYKNNNNNNNNNNNSNSNNNNKVYDSYDRCGLHDGKYYYCAKNLCCSQYGYCGKNSDHCNSKCQKSYSGSSSNCGKSNESSSSDKSSSGGSVYDSHDRCGLHNGKYYYCAKNLCCSQYGYCGQSSDHCNSKCQKSYSGSSSSCGKSSGSSSNKSSSKYTCEHSSSYCTDRCYRKLDGKYWKYNKKSIKIDSSLLKNTYCKYDQCQQAFDDYHYTDVSDRSSYWKKCKKSIESDLNKRYNTPYSINDKEVEY